jgi:nitrogen-specific signal transduction histidine kinase
MLQGRVAGCNLAFARWLGVGARRLQGMPLAALEAGGEALRAVLGGARTPSDAPRMLRRVALAFPGGAPAFADLALTRRGDDGWLLEAHPVAEFPARIPRSCCRRRCRRRSRAWRTSCATRWPGSRARRSCWRGARASMAIPQRAN